MMGDRPVLLRAALLTTLVVVSTGGAPAVDTAAPHAVDLKSPDGTRLRATYFGAGQAGPGVLLFHQSNRTRASWDGVAVQLAASGIHVLAVDARGHGESGADNYADPDWAKTWWPQDLDAGLAFLSAQPGVQRDVI